MSHLLRCDLAWNISFSSRFDDRLPHFGLWGFHAHLLPRMLHQVAIWQLNDFIPISQTCHRRSARRNTCQHLFPIRHKTAIVVLPISQITSDDNFDQCMKSELTMQQNAWMCQRSGYNAAVFCIYYIGFCASICHPFWIKWASDPDDLQSKMGTEGLSKAGMHIILNAVCLSLACYAIWNCLGGERCKADIFQAASENENVLCSVLIFCTRVVCGTWSRAPSTLSAKRCNTQHSMC